MSQCLICDEIASGKLVPATIGNLRDYRGKCEGCGGDISIDSIMVMYLWNKPGAHIFLVADGTVTNCCGKYLDNLALLCGNYGMDVTEEFKNAHKHIENRNTKK